MEKVVFTNGCFDIIHPGHLDLLERARRLGTKLIVGINSDRSVRSIKGAPRPFFNETERSAVLRGLKTVDDVRIFDENTPERLIREIRPDVLVKGGDWATGEIIGADFVLSHGGEVHSLPLLDGFSSSSIVDKILATREKADPATAAPGDGAARRSLRQHEEVFRILAEDSVPVIEESAELILSVLTEGGKILVCGNGGSAADAQHLAAEFVGRYETERVALPAIALTTDTSALTALANDYGFERVFARQVEALARPGDVLIALSTSGNSPNVIAAVMAARQAGCRIIGLTGLKGKKLAALCDQCLLAPSERTARIQEAHITIAHIWCEIIDQKIKEKGFAAAGNAGLEREN